MVAITAAGLVGIGARDARADTVAMSIAVGQSPRVVAIAPNGKVFVSNRTSESLSVISSSSDTVIDTIPLTGVGNPPPIRPGALHIGTDGRVYVPDHVFTGSQMAVVDSSTDAVIKTVSTGGFWPSSVDTSNDNSHVVVTNENSNSVAVFDGSLNLLTNPPITVGAKPHTVVVNPAGTKAYVGRRGDPTVSDPGSVVVIDLAALKVVANLTVGTDPSSMHFVGTTLFVGNAGSSSVSLIDTGSDSVIKTVPTEGAPHGIEDTPDHSKVFVANEAAGTVTVLSSAGDVLAASIPVALRPQRIHVTADGKRAYVPNEGSDSVSIIDTASLSVVQTLDSTAGMGAAPTSLEILGSSKVYVADKSSNEVSVISVQETAPVTPSPATSTPGPSVTAAPSQTAIATATLAPGETPSPTDTPADVSASGGTPSDGAGSDASPTDAAASQTAAVLGATAQPGSATPSSSPTPRTSPTMMAVGIIAQSTADTSSAADVVDTSSGGGGAPSWIWLAASLGVLGVAGAGGYLGRARIKPYLSRFRR